MVAAAIVPLLLNSSQETDLRWHSRKHLRHAMKNQSRRQLDFKLNPFVFRIILLLLFPTVVASRTIQSRCSGWPADHTLRICFAVDSSYDFSQYRSHILASEVILKALQNNATGTAAGKLLFYRYELYMHRRNNNTRSHTARLGNYFPFDKHQNSVSEQQSTTSNSLTPVTDTVRNVVMGRKLTALPKCVSKLRSFAKPKAMSRSNSKAKNTHTVIVSMSDQFVDKADVMDLLRHGHFVFGVQEIVSRG